MRKIPVRLKLIMWLPALLLLLFCSKVNFVQNPVLSESPELPTEDIIAFTAISGDWTESVIYVVKIDKENNVVTSQIHPSLPIVDVQLSPDNKKIAFYYFTNEKDGIYTMGIDGTDITQLTDFGYYAQWSSDGRWISFQNQTQDASGDTIDKVYAVNSETLEVYTCAERQAVYSVEWRSNSYNILYITGNPHYSSQIYQCNVSDKTGVIIQNTDIDSVFDLFVSPDGQKIIYSIISDEEGVFLDYRLAELKDDEVINSQSFLKTNGSGESKLPSIEPYISWSPDSRFFAATLTYPVSPSDIYIFDIQGNIVKQLTNTPEWGEGTPVWSDSGKFVVYTRRPTGVGKVLDQVVAINVSNGTEIVIVSEPETDFFISK